MIDKETIVFILPSVHHVLKGEKILKKTQIPFDLIPVPKEINPECGMAIETREPNAKDVYSRLTQANLPVEFIYRRQGRHFTLWSSAQLDQS